MLYPKRIDTPMYCGKQSDCRKGQPLLRNRLHCTCPHYFDQTLLSTSVKFFIDSP